MEKQTEIAIFTEELWQTVMAMTAGGELTAGDVLQAWETIHGRLLRWQERSGDGQPSTGSTTQS